VRAAGRRRAARANAAATALALGAALSGCAEMVRWPDRMDQPAAPARRAEPAPGGHYVVKPGDTLYAIAFRNQLDFRELAIWNDIGPDYLIRPGEVIRLGAPELSAAGPTSAVRRPPPVAGTPRPAAPVPMPAPAPRTGPGVVTPPPQAPISEWRWPVKGAVIKPFSDSGKGVDIGGTLGQPVLAAGAGKVVYSGSALKGYGELIIIKHDEEHLSAYGYNRRRLVGEGATVVAGQPIAELGLGPEQKPVLHFEIRRQGKPVDPLRYLPPG
jgi:lipoprotein NlpD